jgi:hypothetical protein
VVVVLRSQMALKHDGEVVQSTLIPRFCSDGAAVVDDARYPAAELGRDRSGGLLHPFADEFPGILRDYILCGPLTNVLESTWKARLVPTSVYSLKLSVFLHQRTSTPEEPCREIGQHAKVEHP